MSNERIDALNRSFYRLCEQHAAAVRSLLEDTVQELRDITAIKIFAFQSQEAAVMYCHNGIYYLAPTPVGSENREAMGLIEICARTLVEMGAITEYTTVIEVVQ